MVSQRTVENQEIRSKILTIYSSAKKRLGSYKICRRLDVEYGIYISTGRVYRLMKFMNLPKMSTVKPVFKSVKSDSNIPCTNVVNQKFNTKLNKNGVRVLSARENISDDASGVLMEAVLEGLAEYYSKELGQKTKRGMDINAEKCLCTGGNVAIGYKVDKNKQFYVDEDAAPIVLKIFEMYATGSTMAEIVRFLNTQKFTTSYGNEFNKNSINRILTNKRYAGIYTYKGKEFPDSMPRIVPDILFYEVQDMIQKKKKAPARAKTSVDYILTTKLFCGHCKAAMIGISGTGNSGGKYHYYQCVNNRKKQCNKKTVKKEYIEDIVVNETRRLLTNENIDIISRQIVDLSEKEKNSDTFKRLQRLLKENDKASTNLMNALKQGKAVDIILEEIEKMKQERTDLELQIQVETPQHPTLTIHLVKVFMKKFKNGDVNDIAYRKALIDTFVGKIYVYDDKMAILVQCTR